MHDAIRATVVRMHRLESDGKESFVYDSVVEKAGPNGEVSLPFVTSHITDG